jgi:anti-sigma B factor antagonist
MGVAQRFNVVRCGAVTVARFVDSRIIDETAIQDVAEQMSELAYDATFRPLVINFANVEFLSSALLGSLIRLNRTIEASLGRLILCNLRPPIREVFDITKLSTRFDIRDSEADALAVFESSELSSV